MVPEHGSATVGFEQYQPVLERAQAVLSPEVQVTLLADRGFEQGELMRWLNKQQWDWAIRLKSDLLVPPPRSHESYFPPEQVDLVGPVRILGDIDAYLATTNVPGAQDIWAVFSSQSASLQTFTLYGQRFGGIEYHFKDYKSAALDVLDSGLHSAQVLTRLVMLLHCAYLCSERSTVLSGGSPPTDPA